MGIKKRQRTEEWVRRNSRAVIVANFKHRAQKRERAKEILEEAGIPMGHIEWDKL